MNFKEKIYNEAYRQGQKDMLDACIAKCKLVENLYSTMLHDRSGEWAYVAAECVAELQKIGGEL